MSKKDTRRLFVLWTVVLFCIIAIFPTTAQENLTDIVKKISPSVVMVLTYDKEGEVLTRGSGFFIGKERDVITNRHVLLDAERAEIKTADKKVYPIKKVLAEDKEGDLIRVSVEVPQNTIRPLSVSDSIPEVGEQVVVIGSPFGLEQTVSDGIVSAVRDISEFGKIVQITAPISSGSSGSPVVNMKGEVIGVATFQMVEGQNLNFAVLAERLAKLKPDKGKTFAEWKASIKEKWITSAEGLYFTGLRFYWKEDYEKALPYFKKAIKKNPHHDEAYFRIGYCNIKLGRYQEAIEAYKQAIRIKPDYAEAHLYLGWTYSKLGRDQEAVEAYKQAIRIKPDYAEAHCSLGWTYSKLGRWQEAIEADKQAIRIKPDYANAHYNLGLAYGALERYKEAVEAYKQAIRIKPDFADAHYFLGLAYGELGRFNEAVKAFKQAIRIKPDYAEAHYFLGFDYGALGRFNEAVKAFKQAIRIKPDYAKAHLGLGLAYLILEDTGSAFEEYKILKNLDKDLANKLFNSIYSKTRFLKD